MAGITRRMRPFRNIYAKIAALPMILTTLVVFVGGTIWTVTYSFTRLEASAAHEFRGLRPV
jgi:glucose/mannose transport system permease protein